MMCDRLSKTKDLVLDMSRIAKDNDSGNISWARYEPGIYTDLAYHEEYRKLIDKGQYSILLKDQSFIQLYYSFDKQAIKKARLAYYPNPYDLSDIDYTNDEITELMEGGMSHEDIIGSLKPKHHTHLRIDYDGAVKTHSKTHLQFSAINTLRIDMEYCLLPMAFLNFIIENFYPSVYEQVNKIQSYIQSVKHANNNKIRQKDHRPHFYLTCQ